MKRKTRNLVIGLSALMAVLLAGMVILGVWVVRSGVTAGPDKLFGDQHLKTAVALIELHKVRNGEYPATLDDIKFEGGWDIAALKSVSYRANADRTAYYIEVERGWIGKPKLEMPEGFWRNTGYDPALKRQRGTPDDSR